MAEEYVISIHEAVKLYDCLASMQIGSAEISVLSAYTFDSERGKYKFSVKGYEGKYVYANYDELCIITLDDYTLKIVRLTALQLRITAFILAQKTAKLFAKNLAQEKIEWERQRNATLEDTVIIPELLPELEDEDPKDEESQDG